ncbi:hypothetical protein [Staphylococcus caeli]|uniref:hypothetical protein n=1 Tax=Staphylococcus caeli TaxID=2201815 RepID=UPI003F54EDEF
METITLTKKDLIQIVEQEVSKRLDGKKSLSSNSIFNQVRIKPDDFTRINNKYEVTGNADAGRLGVLNHPITLKKYNSGFEKVHYKAFVYDVHDHIRKLTLSAFGVTLNSDLSESEYELAAKIYRDIKGYYLHLYEKRISGLTVDDFE